MIDVDDRGKTVRVESAPAGRVPRFEGGEPGSIHDKVVAKMRNVFMSPTNPIYLNRMATSQLEDGRKVFHEAGLACRSVTVDDDQIILFPWHGTSMMHYGSHCA